MESNKFQPTQDLYLEHEDKTYRLKVSPADFDKAQNDINFAYSLLFHADVCATSETHSSPLTVDPETELELTKRSNWAYDAIICLINSMETHIEDLNHPKKKKHVFENVSNDLISKNYQFSALQCQIKWKSLIRSYKVAKDNQTKTGRGPSRFQFFERLDELLGDKPSNHCTHSRESSVVIDITHNDVESEDGSVDVLSPSTSIPSVSTPPTSTHKKEKLQKF